MHIKKAIYLILLLVFLALLAGYSIAGWHTRYQADDYCYDAEFARQGFFRGQVHSYLEFMPYSSNRYALTLSSSLGWLLGGVPAQPFFPAFGLLLWGFSLYYAARQVKLSPLTCAFIATALLFFTLLLAPNRYQVLFWRSGMLTYLLPLALNTLLAGRLIHRAGHGRLAAAGAIELGLLAFLAAGFSETIFALQTAVWGLALVYTLWRQNKTARNAVLVTLAGGLLGGLILLLCPTNAIRQAPFPPPPPIWSVAVTALRFTFDFLTSTLRAAPLPFLALAAAGVLVGWLEAPAASLRWRTALIWLGGLMLASMMLIVCIMAPTIWSMSAYPEPRGLLSGVFILVLLLFGAGMWAGAVAAALLHGRLPARMHLAAGVLLMLLIGGYTARFIPSTYALIPQYRQRAQAWDARNNQIIRQAAAGQTHLLVDGIDSIADIFELQPDEDHWVNRCAAQYYGVAGIKSEE